MSTIATMTAPPSNLVVTRESLRAVACYAIAPARKARTGRIGLRPVGDGIGTPPFDDGTRISVTGDRLVAADRQVRITTVRAAAEFLGIAITPDPGVGRDLPRFAPDDELDVDADTSRWLGTWYRYGAAQLDRLATRLAQGTVSEAQLWPEHFDLAVTVAIRGAAVNIGFSPGDNHSPEPYVYVGPHDRSGLDGDYWNAPFGATLTHVRLRTSSDPGSVTGAFIDEGLRLLGADPATSGLG
jgi:hypothetical protein